VWMLLFFLSMSSAKANNLNCSKHPIYCQIKKNAPKLNKEEVLKLSNVIHKISRKYNLPTRIFVGILAQESGYKLEATGCHKGLVRELKPELRNTNSSGELLVTYTESMYEMKEIKVCADFGIGQIYYKTAQSFQFDLNKLTTDLEYSINASAKILADFQKRYSTREVDWWTRYNASSKIKRKIYKTLVERYL